MLARTVTILLLPIRLGAVLVCIAVGLILQLSLFGWVKPHLARGIVTVWSRAMLRCLGVGVRRLGTPSASPALFVCNHVSWLDILTLQATAPVVFVAKSEIKSWPVLGWMVSLAGTCFIHRDRRTALRGVHSTLAAHLATGQSVCIFPEGTTSDGAHVLPFHAGLLQAAIEASVPLQPMRLDYSSQAAAYVGDITLLGSVARIVCAPNLFVTVRCLPCIAQEGCKRQELALLAHERITSAKNSRPYERESSAALFR